MPDDLDINIDAYLARIGYDGPRDPTLDTLRALHRAHLLSVPFENLDIHPPFQREIVLDVRQLLDKVVGERRGGFCYELNGLFAELLRACGFNVTMLSAGVHRRDGRFGPDFDHLLLHVDLDGEVWLADVGFGDSFIEPIRLSPEIQHDAHGGSFRIGPDHTSHAEAHILHRMSDGSWERQYRYSLTPCSLTDCAEMCRYQQTSPDSAFTRGRVCSMFTADGHVSLTDSRLIMTDHGQRREESIDGEVAFLEGLSAHFGIRPVTST